MVIFMSNPTRIPLIVGGVVGLVAMAVCLFLPKDEQKDPSLQNTNPTTSIQIQVPTGPTDPTEIPPVIVIPGDNDPTTPTDPAGPTQPIPGNPVVEGSERNFIDRATLFPVGNHADGVFKIRVQLDLRHLIQ